MSTVDLVREMGTPESITSYEDEKALWLSLDYNLDLSMAFLLGFDQVYVFPQQNKYCLWKAYVKDGKVVYMNLTTQWVDEQYYGAIMVKGKFGFLASTKDVEKALGDNFYPDRRFTYTDYLYHDLGIRFTFRGDKITNIYLFRLLDNRADLGRLIKHFPKDNK